METTLPLILLILAGLIITVVIIYAVRYKREQRRRKINPFRSQEPRVGNINITQTPHYENDTELEGIIGEVRIRYAEKPLDIPSEPAASYLLAEAAKSSCKKPLLVLHVLAAEEQSFVGYELLQSLLSAGLRFGEMNIFHRHEQASGHGKIIFSLASATEPGTFNLDEIGSLVCKGLSLFMDSAKVENPEAVFELMLDTARLLAEDLGGNVYDNHYQMLTAQGLADYRRQITV